MYAGCWRYAVVFEHFSCLKPAPSKRLAIAALLFHNEAAGPDRVFTAGEWHVFLDGYGEHVQLSEIEKSSWEDILLCGWMDDETGWADPKQSELLRSLL